MTVFHVQYAEGVKMLALNVQAKNNRVCSMRTCWLRRNTRPSHGPVDRGSTKDAPPLENGYCCYWCIWVVWRAVWSLTTAQHFYHFVVLTIFTLPLSPVNHLWVVWSVCRIVQTSADHDNRFFFLVLNFLFVQIRCCQVTLLVSEVFQPSFKCPEERFFFF